MQGQDRETTSPYRLIPVTSSSTSRYSKSACVQLCPRIISRGPASRASLCSNSNWQQCVHPEGQPYFAAMLDGEVPLVVVTEANVEDEATRNQIQRCIHQANDELYRRGIKLPPRCELFLELEDDQSCNYYFVHHTEKILFWFEDVCTELLDIPPAASDSHLNTELERLYWVHVEYFPMHHGTHQQQFLRMADDLYNVISHGQADRLTSKTSTFPYTAETCRHFLELLSRKRGQGLDGYTLCYAARLAGSIANQRFVTFYGQQPAQLDRLQEMFPVDVVHHTWLMNIANFLMWGIPLQYNNLLDDLYVNEQVYVDQWTSFMSKSLTDWTTSLSWSLPVFIASVLLANVRGGTLPTSVLLASATSIASASCLHLRHQPLAESSASIGARYLRSARSSAVGFLPSSVVFSLPRASYLWSVGLLISQFLFVTSQGVDKVVASIAATFIAAIMAFTLYVIYPEETNVGSLFQSAASFCIPRWYASDAPEVELPV